MNEQGAKAAGDESISLIHFTLPFSTSKQQFVTLLSALFEEAGLWRHNTLPKSETAKEKYEGPKYPKPYPTSSDWKKALVLLHECEHFWQAIGTTYGFHYMRATMAQSYWVRDMLRLLQAEGRKQFKLPLSKLNLDDYSDGARTELATISDRWWCLEKYKAALHGFVIDQTVTREQFFSHIWPRATESIFIFDSVSGTFGGQLGNHELRLDHQTNVPEIALIHPTYGLRFSGQAVMEASALFDEIQIMSQVRDRGELDPEYVDHRIKEVPAYGMAFSWIRPAFPKDLEDKDIRITLRRMVPRLLDLALMPLCDPAYITPRATILKWVDIHPGFRLVLATKALEEIGIQGLGEESESIKFDELIIKICERNGWVTPDQLARAGSKRYEASAGGDPSVTYVNTHPETGAFRLHFNAADLRVLRTMTEPLLHFPYLFSQFQPPSIHFNAESLLSELLVGYVFYQRLMRTIFLHDASALTRHMVSSDTGASQYGSAFDSMLNETLWKRTGLDRAQFN